MEREESRKDSNLAWTEVERGAASRIEKKNGVVKREDPRGGGPLETPLVDRQSEGQDKN